MRSASILVAAAALVGCVTASGPPMVEMGQIDLSDDRGAIIFGMDVEAYLLTTPMTVRIRRYDPGTGQLAPATDTDAITSNYAFSSSVGTPNRYRTYIVPPGHYAVTSVGETTTFTHASFGGGNPFAGLAATLGVAAGTAIASGLNNGWISFVTEGGRLTDDAPRFSVQAGRAAYIGELEFRAESRYETVKQATHGADVADPEPVKTRVVEDRQITLGYGRQTLDVQRYAEARGLPADRVDDIHLAAFDNGRFVVKDFDTVDTRRRTIP